MNFIKIFFILLLFSSLFPVNAKPGTWFTESQKLPMGFMLKELTISNTFHGQEFILAKLSFNKTSGWEEFRITGNATDVEGHTELSAVFCRHYVQNNLNDRWVLTRAYECDHLGFRFFPKEKKLKPSFELEGHDVFTHYAQFNLKKIPSISVTSSILWGSRIRYLKRIGSISGIQEGSYVPVSKTESTLKLEGIALDLNRFYEITNRSGEGLF